MPEIDKQPSHLVERRRQLIRLVDADGSLGLRLLVDGEMAGIFGQTQATNILTTAVDGNGKFVIIKKYVDDPTKGGQTPEERAHNEHDILDYLCGIKYKRFVSPSVVGRVDVTENNEPVGAQRYMPTYIPVDVMRPTIVGELTHGQAFILPKLFAGLASLHRKGVVHQDLMFGENLGIVKEKGRVRAAFIDFELSKRYQLSEMSSNEVDEIHQRRVEDLEQFTAYLLGIVPSDGYEVVKRRLTAIIGYNYHPSLIGLSAQEKDQLGKVIVARAEERNTTSKMLLVYG